MSAAASPEWAERTEFRLDGDIAERRFNARLRQAGDREDFPILIVIAVTLNDADRASFPIAGESPRFAELEAFVAERVAGRAVLAGVAADSEAWLFFLYAARTTWLPEFEDLFRLAAGDHEVGFAVRDDRRWRAYQQYCPRVRNPARERAGFVGLGLLGLTGLRYGPAWALGGIGAYLLWLVPMAWLRRYAAGTRRAGPALGLALTAYVLATIFLSAAEIFWHPRSPLTALAVAAGLGLVAAIVIWPAHGRLRVRTRARAALRAPVGPAV